MKAFCIRSAMRSLSVGVLLSGLSLLLATSPAISLQYREAEAVVSIVEALAADMGEGMSADAADIFYDYDSYGAGLIPAAGFSRDSWKQAYDAVSSGYMATIPQEEFDAIFEEPLARLDAAGLPDDQKAMMRAHVEDLVAEAQAVRVSGLAHADVVRPLADRLSVLFFGAFGE